MYEKNKRKLMMKLKNEEQIYQRRKRRWRGCGHLNIGIIGLITIFLLTVTHSSEEHSLNHQNSKVNESPLIDQLINHKIVKRSIDPKVPKKLDSNEAQSLNDVNSDSDSKLDKQHQTLYRRQQGTSPNPRHVHSNGDVYFFKGYKCVPIRKPSNRPAELKKPRSRVGRLWS